MVLIYFSYLLYLMVLAKIYYVFMLSSSSICLMWYFLPQYLMNRLNNFDKTAREYSLGPNDDLIRFWRSGSQQTVLWTTSHELLEQSRWNLQGITDSPYWWPDWILEVICQGHSRLSRWRRHPHVDTEASKFI